MFVVTESDLFILTIYCLVRTKSARIAKISILKLEGIIKKIPMSVATMSR